MYLRHMMSGCDCSSLVDLLLSILPPPLSSEEQNEATFGECVKKTKIFPALTFMEWIYDFLDRVRSDASW